ncbi:nose resistant to fluoxetine protein 6 [Parasteatoda tepidariorum]|uniref:nose resistant to fluoxetine protein 6 n=1 Tax=Parasteatoda tepidariorum TaxID=114398 RepID=UPI001C721239|nr:nose resistant to fluoxetine protein 6 [Parasteatoda tepidariorum]
MKLVFLFAFFPYVLSADYRRNVYPSFEGNIQNNHEYQTQSIPESVDIVVKSWLATDLSLRKISEKLVQTLLPSAFKLLTTSKLTTDCSKDIVNFLRGIAETKIWAYQMVDSFGKIPTGMVMGTVSSLGDYQTCLNATAPDLFIGKYCLVDFEIPLPEQRYFHLWKKDVIKAFNLSHNDSIANEFLKFGEKLYMLHPRTSICIPSTCTDEDARLIARKAIQLAGLHFNTNIKNCETKLDPVEVTFLDILLGLLLISLVLVVLVATIMDFYQRVTSDISEREEGLSPFLSFSFFINAERLVKNDDSPDSIRVFYGLRVITMIWLIMTHVGHVDHVEAFGGLRTYFDLTTKFLAQIVPSGVVAVETFFFMSATLLSYNLVRVSDQKMNFGLIFLRRYARTTIPHLMMIAVTSILTFVGTGPLFKEIIGKEAQNCKERGWMNLLYINNFIPFDDICMRNSWYLSVDIQLFLTAILVIVPFRNNPRAAIVCIVALLFSGIFGTFISHILYNLPPTCLTINLQSQYISELFQRSYLMPHFHLPTYCIGLLVGYFLALRKYVRVTRKVNLILWIAAISTQLVVVFLPYIWNKGTEFPGLLPSLLFGCSHRVLWALSLAWITIACQSDLGGIIAKILGSQRFELASRLTFMAYLTNFTIKYLYIGTVSNVIIYNSTMMFNMFASILTATFLFSFVLTLLFEAPFTNLEKTVIRNMRWRKLGKGI